MDADEVRGVLASEQYEDYITSGIKVCVSTRLLKRQRNSVGGVFFFFLLCFSAYFCVFLRFGRG